MSDAAATAGERRRAVILVGNPANPYSRAIRIGRTLAANGYDVEIHWQEQMAHYIREGYAFIGV